MASKPKNRLSEGEIFMAANKIAQRSHMPTIKAICFQLNDNGSETTIPKYLMEWKKALLKKAEVYEGIGRVSFNDAKRLIQERILLKNSLEQQTKNNEVLTSDLLIAEREIAKLKEECYGYQKDLDEIKSIKKDHEQIKITCEEVLLERKTAIDKILADKNQFIEALRVELQETHKENLEQARNWSYQQDEVLIQEKVKSLNLSGQVKTLNEELKQVSLELEKVKNMVEPLKREVLRQKKIIEDQVDFNRLVQKVFEKGEQGGIG